MSLIEVNMQEIDTHLELPMQPSVEEATAFAVAAEREACAKILELKTSELLLMVGEMTAQELRTVKAVLKGLASRIRNR